MLVDASSRNAEADARRCACPGTLSSCAEPSARTLKQMLVNTSAENAEADARDTFVPVR